MDPIIRTIEKLGKQKDTENTEQAEMEFELDANLSSTASESVRPSQDPCIESEILKGRDTVSRVASAPRPFESGIVEPGQPIRPPPIIFRRNVQRPLRPVTQNHRRNVEQLPFNTQRQENMVENPVQNDETSDTSTSFQVPVEQELDEDSVWFMLVSEGLL